MVVPKKLQRMAALGLGRLIFQRPPSSIERSWKDGDRTRQIQKNRGNGRASLGPSKDNMGSFFRRLDLGHEITPNLRRSFCSFHSGLKATLIVL